MYKLIPLWWVAFFMHVWWGYKLIKKCELESRAWFMEIRRPYLLNKEFRPKYRGFIQHILMKYYIIHCIIGMYCWYISNTNLKWLYYFHGFSVFLNTYSSYKMHCNDILKNKIENEAFYWKLDEFSINSLIFSRFLILYYLFELKQLNLYLSLSIYVLNCYIIYKKKSLKKYDFIKKLSFPVHFVMSQFCCLILYVLSGFYSFHLYEQNIQLLIGWLSYFIAFVLYYSKFCYKSKNIYIQQHDIAHLLININFLFCLVSDII